MSTRRKILEELAKCLKATKDAADKMASIEGNRDLSQEGRKRRMDEAQSALTDVLRNARVKINVLLANKAAEIEAQEAALLTKNDESLDFQQRILTKATILAGLDFKELTDDALNSYVSEFRGYPLAAAFIMQKCREGSIKDDNKMLRLGVALQGTTGNRREEILRFSESIDAALSAAATTHKSAANTIALLENRMSYVDAQDEDFTLSSAEVAQRMGDAAKTGSMAFQFGTPIR